MLAGRSQQKNQGACPSKSVRARGGEKLGDTSNQPGKLPSQETHACPKVAGGDTCAHAGVPGGSGPAALPPRLSPLRLPLHKPGPSQSCFSFIFICKDRGRKEAELSFKKTTKYSKHKNVPGQYK